jgi:hypothetical protein
VKLCEDSHIYLNPTFNELTELSNRSWDSIRICVTEKDDILMASGYGNTHSSIIKQYRKLEGVNKYESLVCFILYKEAGVAYFNTEDIVGGRLKHRSPGWEKYFSDNHVDMIKDIIRESDLVL